MFSKRTINKKDQDKPYRKPLIPHAALPPYLTTVDSVVSYVHWDMTILASIQGRYLGYRCRTEEFFHMLRLHEYVATCNTTVQLGAWTGKFLDKLAYGFDKPLSKDHVKIGYDYSVRAIEYLQDKGIQGRQIDLNAVEKLGEKVQLAYLDQLKADLSTKANILAIRIFEYLEPETVPLLMCALMDFSQPGSTLFLAGRALKTPNEAHAVNDDPRRKKKITDVNCMSRFFHGRNDMAIKLNTIYHGDEVLVVKKIDPERKSWIRRKCSL